MTAPSGPQVNLLETLFQQSADYAVFVADASGIVQSWNTGAARIFGLAAETILGQHVSLLYREQDRAARVAEADLRAASESGSASERRWMLRNDGRQFWADGAITALRTPTGELTGYGYILRDASDNIRLEQKLERATDELQRFAFTVSHDLQEPLRNVRNYAELLERRYKGSLDQDADEFIRFMIEGSNRMAQLLKDILSYSQAGREDKTRPERTDASNVLQWALMNVDPVAKQSGATITHSALPTVMVDQTQLATVFQHLLANALKFRSPEPPLIHIQAEPAADDFWMFSVRDNGIGVEPEHTERIFGVFKRLHGRDVPGTGIGLSICRKIIEAHGGRIWFESQPGSGSTVKFTLPGA